MAEQGDGGGGQDGYGGGARGGLRVVLSSISNFTAKGILPSPFVFQAPPLDSFQVSHTSSHAEYQTLRLGQLSRPGVRQLTTIQFDTLFVDYEPWWSFRPANPKAASVTLMNILRTGTPFRLTITNPDLWSTPDVDMGATLRNLTVTEKNGEIDSRYLNVQFSEFRSEDLSLGGAAKISGVTTVDVGTLPAGQQSVADIAKTYYGSASETEPIRQANAFLSTVGNSDNLVEVFGDDPTARLKIPGARA